MESNKGPGSGTGAAAGVDSGRDLQAAGAATGGRELVVKVTARLRKRGQTLALAESCTGGLLSSWITELPGVSDVYIGGVVAYANQVKESVLNVQKTTLIASGAVSVQTAGEMAQGARLGLGAHWALSITGIAGPNGGTPQKPVGTVCFGLSGLGLDGRVVEATELQHFNGDRREIQTASALYALGMLWRQLEKEAGHGTRQKGP